MKVSSSLGALLTRGAVQVSMELKVWRGGEPDPKARGLEQIEAYLSGLGLEEGWLFVFDRRPGQPRLSERVSTEAAMTASGRAVTVIRA